MTASITFLGAAGTVTGSRFLLQVEHRQYLVDCGLFQGGRKLKEKNWKPFPVAADRLEAILLTHAHIDHTGYLPRLVAEGFHGPVYATHATCDLLGLLLPDCAYLQEQDAAYANKKGYSRHRPALPLYTSAQAREALRLLQSVGFGQPLSLSGLEATFFPAGHILGSAILQLDLKTQKGPHRVVFSGDLGRYESAVMRPPVTVPRADTLVIESTYGGRHHEDQPIGTMLADLISEVAQQKGVLLIPAFAVGRTQQILYHIRQLQARNYAPDLPVFIDSPMAVDASRIYCHFGDDHNLDVNLLMDERVCPLRCRETHFVKDVELSKELNTTPGPAVIISASGMCTGGRILHHLKWRLPHTENKVLFIGYQAEGTRGRALLEGADSVRIHGERIPVRASVHKIDALSAHADHEELIGWLQGVESAPGQVFIVHGEDQARLALQEDLDLRLRIRSHLPHEGQTFELDVPPQHSIQTAAGRQSGLAGSEV